MSEIWKINPQKIDSSFIAEAAKRVDQGQLVIFPTETVYGVAVNLLNESALKRIYQIKKRPEEKPLTLHIADRAQAEQWAIVSAEAKRLMDRWWPGPLTLLLPAKGKGGGKLGFRFPDHPVALALLREVHCPVGAPSANRSGQRAPTTAMEAWEQLGEFVDIILDAGPTPLEQSSTILDLTIDPPRVIREGAIPAEIVIASPC